MPQWDHYTFTDQQELFIKLIAVMNRSFTNWTSNARTLDGKLIFGEDNRPMSLFAYARGSQYSNLKTSFGALCQGSKKSLWNHWEEVGETLLTGFKSSAMSGMPAKKITSANQNHLINHPCQSPSKQPCHWNQKAPAAVVLVSLHQHPQCKSVVQSPTCAFVQSI